MFNQKTSPTRAPATASQTAATPKSMSWLLALAVAIFFIGAAVAGYRAVDGLMAEKDAARINAEANLAREQAEMYRGQAEANQTEAEKWRGFATTVSAWADPLGVLPKTLGAVALIIVAVGTAMGVGRLLWGMGRSTEAYVEAAVRVREQQALLMLEGQKRREALPVPAVPRQVTANAGKRGGPAERAQQRFFAARKAVEVGDETSPTT